MNKKIFFLAMILMLIFSLAACGRADNTVDLIAVNNPYGEAGEKLVFDHDKADQIIFKGDNGLSYWSLTKSGNGTLTNFEGSLPSNVVTNDDGVRTYTFNVEGFTPSFQVYIKPETIVGDPNDIVMIAFRYEVENVLYRKGQTFDPTGMLILVVQRDGSIIELKGEEVADLFDDHDYVTYDEDGFKDQHEYTVTFTYQGFEQDFSVYVAGGERPLSTHDANFFDWILVIPVAFLMNFFGSLMGNSFAIGILFTTLVVRTIAWPIYAKSNDMSIKMNLAQPDMQRVQAKYATKKDPQSQQQQQMEMMQVYKKHGINVLGCLFPFLQMPIFIAMYGVVRRITIEGGMYTEGVSNTNFLGINLANTQDGIIGMVLAGIVGGTMYLLQKISMKKPSYAKNTAKHNPNPQAAQTEKTMKFVSYFMVIMMAFASYQSNALALYWIFGNIYSLGQTLFNRRLNEKKHEQLKQKQLMG
ncbi:YidC/Oxa1 family membrane protein insertase [Peloplasma aerotolerans]|jgi:YidC/Oxa1 family membrane protein insertase|uniref:YidC/Oxa1 family membrane protein insertase n=1 Tax=Peloplasma aerotolerans TaxID=3044389 RepID=A0AAW6UB88_9MOLU|nr:YidC/Oxa1 family membrane protein insertase [Mariniplasma sp. M4Ah]MDI6452203.1 YidC/Oxa1 family membrane protein insertase [Mariniplasma sp. M4Ah]MDR4968255.1 YidC/Oxa1 family membrane protein insertase [Acholeplasmataceae bacterium]